MIVRAAEGESPEGTAERALWATIDRRLQAAGAPEEAAAEVRRLVKVRMDGETRSGAVTTLRFSLHQRMSDYTVRYDRRTGELMSWFFDALMEACQPGHDEETCRQAATAVADPPPDAVPEVAELEEHGDATVFRARWRHLDRGIPVERDYIQVLINPRTARPFAYHRKWHVVDEAWGSR